jgi:hypothetical protein
MIALPTSCRTYVVTGPAIRCELLLRAEVRMLPEMTREWPPPAIRLPLKQAFEPVRTEYIHCLQAARPALDEQLADVNGVIVALTEGGDGDSGGSSPLDRARAAYVDHLRIRQITFDQQIVELAALCAVLFLPDFWAF